VAGLQNTVPSRFRPQTDEALTALREKRQQHYVSLSRIRINHVGFVLSIALAFNNRKVNTYGTGCLENFIYLGNPTPPETRVLARGPMCDHDNSAFRR